MSLILTRLSARLFCRPIAAQRDSKGWKTTSCILSIFCIPKGRKSNDPDSTENPLLIIPPNGALSSDFPRFSHHHGGILVENSLIKGNKDELFLTMERPSNP